MPMTTADLHNEQLNLRPFTMADGADYYALVREKSVATNAGFTPVAGLMEAQYLLKRQLTSPQLFAIVLRATGKVIGSIGLYERMNAQGEPAPSQMDLGYMLNVAYWHHGYMTAAVHLLQKYAFEALALKRLTASCLQANVASALILQHAGFRQYDQVTHPAYAQFGAGQTELFFENVPTKSTTGDEHDATR
ncbi:N-acetyltransferase [Lactobacillus sp. CBA3606]|uniref:GNAT family N-acetyltransferase n=1 Tax=Lactobacillus sp. CBA3606 TaxID=2099789 RepID=UPI000CFA83DE|nr:GNAT family N-acetyltransferase [Lactobacillus sp. CBA3606]AVK64728.1 N-acetyltransferase [Lactobacillus sp. CBA3606]